MKKVYTFFFAVLATTIGFAQTPQKMSYQCVVRNLSGVLVTNHAVGMKISILQGSASGTVVFSETYSPTPQTNANGLVSIEIGNGLPITGTFSAINWASGPYFLKTETDPSGGTNYTINGTSQLLSVPYAIYSKTAQTADYNSLSNLPTLNITNWNIAYGWGNHAGLYRPIGYVPTWTDITGKPNFATVATSGSYNDLTQRPTIDGSETKVTAGTNVTITGVGTVSSPYVINAAGGGSSHYIGENYGGGIVFYVDYTGHHGLIVSYKNLQSPWSNINNDIGTTENISWNGFFNTNAIVAQSGHTSSAAQLCLNYISDGFDDWYLPAIDQLNLLYNVRYEINKVLANDGNPLTDILWQTLYWSSTQFVVTWYGMTFNFQDGTAIGYDKSTNLSVRAIRSF